MPQKCEISWAGRPSFGPADDPARRLGVALAATPRAIRRSDPSGLCELRGFHQRHKVRALILVEIGA